MTDPNFTSQLDQMMSVLRDNRTAFERIHAKEHRGSRNPRLERVLRRLVDRTLAAEVDGSVERCSALNRTPLQPTFVWFAAPTRLWCYACFVRAGQDPRLCGTDALRRLRPLQRRRSLPHRVH